MTIRIQRLLAVLANNGDSRSTHYSNIAKGLWTKPVKLGARSVGWPEEETQAINAARVAGKTPDEIHELVARLEAARKETT
jgi:prophage regulatory protein